MAVGAPFNTTGWVRESADTTLDLPMTIDSGQLSTYLHLWVPWIGVSTVTSLVWDPLGVNQALSSQVAVLDFGVATHLQGFGLVNPTPGASKVVRITMSSTSDIMLCGAAYAGVNQTTPIANRNSNTTGAALAITTTAGDAATTVIATSNTVSASSQTLIALGSFVLDLGADYGLASGASLTFTWTASGATQAVLGAAIQQAAATTTRGTPFDSEGTAFDGGRCMQGILRAREQMLWREAAKLQQRNQHLRRAA